MASSGAILKVCEKDGADNEWQYVIEVGNNPKPADFILKPNQCKDVTIGKGQYVIRQTGLSESPPISISGDCKQATDYTAKGFILNGINQTCTFKNEKGP